MDIDLILLLIKTFIINSFAWFKVISCFESFCNVSADSLHRNGSFEDIVKREGEIVYSFIKIVCRDEIVSRSSVISPMLFPFKEILTLDISDSRFSPCIV